MEYREFRAESVGVDDEGVLEGLVTPFGSETVIGDLKRGGWREEMAKGTFRKTLEEGDPLMVNQHNMAQPLARKSAGNLELREGTFKGNEGLVLRAVPVDTTYGQDLRKLVKAKVVRGMSFGFNVVKDDWYDDEGKPSDRLHGTRRVVREVKLIEVSPVTRPAYENTSISARDEASALLEQRQAPDEERGPKPYGDVAYADPKNGKYPIDTEEHVRAAWSYINMPKNAAKYPMNGVSLESVKAKIRSAAKKLGIEISEEKSDADDLEIRDPYEDSFYESEDRDDPDGKEYNAIDAAVTALSKNPPDTKGALSVLRANQAQRSQEPESSTPETSDDDLALHMAHRRAIERSRDLGIV